MVSKTFINRLNRLEGQLKKLHQNIEHGADCAEVIPQFLAVKGALGSAFEEYVKESLESCAQSEPEKMKQLIKLLARS
jgi:DNA-binding FrmR family transcriptional regulator